MIGELAIRIDTPYLFDTINNITNTSPSTEAFHCKVVFSCLDPLACALKSSLLVKVFSKKHTPSPKPQLAHLSSHTHTCSPCWPLPLPVVLLGICRLLCCHCKCTRRLAPCIEENIFPLATRSREPDLMGSAVFSKDMFLLKPKVLKNRATPGRCFLLQALHLHMICNAPK